MDRNHLKEISKKYGSKKTKIYDNKNSKVLYVDGLGSLTLRTPVQVAIAKAKRKTSYEEYKKKQKAASSKKSSSKSVDQQLYEAFMNENK
ncbi:hypothetical protein [Candidatus Phytoplasma pruni]|uniref:Uncharacterized protein n=1 Tax=Candidatus Phytoplasma pruni TaxID=479893 RepID=A0A851HJF4_9MOLU|nr:hypothetical protein [Candidatus Phytoplasma pruni]NWN45569.1 hypothetical protein [Candidatus Phytoplasma pruni]